MDFKIKKFKSFLQNQIILIKILKYQKNSKSNLRVHLIKNIYYNYKIKLKI